MRKPNLFIPGFPKSGTSALHSALVQHPEISMGNTKEPHTYSWDNRFRRKDDFFRENYEGLTSKYILDSSTSYMVSEVALKRIIEDTPDAKFIIIARDPIDRIVSHYNWLSSKNLINKKPLEELQEHLDKSFDYRKHYSGNFKTYIDFSLYGKHMKRLLKLAKPENILFFTYEELFKGFETKKQKIAMFLNLNLDDIKVEKINQTTFKSQRRVYKNPILKIIIPFFRKLVRIKNRTKFEIKVLKGHPRGLKIKRPAHFKTSRKEVEGFLLPILEKDTQLLQNLGYDVNVWPTLGIKYK